MVLILRHPSYCFQEILLVKKRLEEALKVIKIFALWLLQLQDVISSKGFITIYSQNI